MARLDEPWGALIAAPTKPEEVRPIPLAVWTPGPSPKELRRSDFRVRHPVGFGLIRGVGYTAFVLALVFAFPFNGLTLTAFWQPALALAGGSLFVSLLIFLFSSASNGDEAHPADLGLWDDPEDPYEAMMEVSIYQSGVLTGSDRGVVAVDGNAIHFHGHRTTFCLGGQDIHRPPRLESARMEDTSHTVRIRLSHQREVVELAFTRLTINGKYPGREDLLPAMERLAAARVSSSCPRMAPPLTLAPEYAGFKNGIFYRMGVVLLAFLCVASWPMVQNEFGIVFTLLAASALAMAWPESKEIKVRRRLLAASEGA